jgi:flagellar hook protein FlgE
MSIYGTMRTSISGMSAQADRLSTIGDNVANVSTTGYKRVSTEFSTLVLQAVGTNYESGAVETNIRRHVSDQGTFDYSNSVTDLAINGQGFFIVEGPSSEVLLTRAGAFKPNAFGELVNSAGATLLGYDLNGGAVTPVVNGSAGLQPVRISELTLNAVPSDEGTLLANLPADAANVAAADHPSELRPFRWLVKTGAFRSGTASSAVGSGLPHIAAGGRSVPCSVARRTSPAVKVRCPEVQPPGSAATSGILSSVPHH